jgi:hypothetical protein
VRQESASVEIEHAAVSLGVLLEYGGRYQALNESVGEADSATANQLLGEIGADDKVAIWTYGDKVEEIAGFSDGRDALGSAVLKLRTPPFSEQNFYDALIAVVTQMHPLSRRKALLLVSSGLDTFSKANYRDALHAVGQSDTPIYAINLGPLLQQHASVSLDAGPYAHIDWKGAESKLRQIAAACGGRVYSPQAVVDLPAIFDDLMENLRVRYVITYKSTSDPNVHRARTVRVELVDSRTSEPSQPPPGPPRGFRCKPPSGPIDRESTISAMTKSEAPIQRRHYTGAPRKSVALGRVHVLTWFRGGLYRLSAGRGDSSAPALVSMLVVSEVLAEHAEYFVAEADM